MAHPLTEFRARARLRMLALTPLAAASFAAAQATTELEPVTVQGRSPNSTAQIGGFGDIPLSKSPLQARVFGESLLKNTGTASLGGLTRLDAATSDAYNAEGYWDQLTVRGYAIDNRYNYRRDGLPINAETRLPLDNKGRIELLKGTSGMQAGTSAPGGLVNLIVKRPEADVRSASLELRGHGTALATLDLGTRFGESRAFGLRLNAAAAHLDPELRHAKGERHLVALAGDWRLREGSLFEAEFESSHQSQPSQPGFSLLGSRVPDARGVDPRTNLNNQPWSEPVVLQGQTVSLRWSEKLGDAWRARLHVATQHLTSDDRVAFPFGCSADGNFDRYCADGSFDLYDFRSNNERRRSDAADLSLQGRVRTGGLEHTLTTGMLHSRFKARFQPQAFNFAGSGNVEGTATTAAAPEATSPSIDRSERSTEFYLRDALRLNEQTSLWLGLRHTRLQRHTVTTEGADAQTYSQSFTAPWLAASYAPSEDSLLYASWGQGVESQATPTLPVYRNAGQTFTLKSRQVELGFKRSGETLAWGAAAFDIERPATTDACDTAAVVSCERRLDGIAHHRGVEVNGEVRLGAWSLGASAMWLRARREDSADPGLQGQRPTNVPARSARLNGSYAFNNSVTADATLMAESNRTLLPADATLRIPGWARTDLGLRMEQRAGQSTLTWRAGLDNAFDRRAWKEAPYQFGHVYLYPLAPRTWRLSLTADL